MAIVRLCNCELDAECMCDGQVETFVIFVHKFKLFAKQHVVRDSFVEDNINKIFSKCELEITQHAILGTEIVGKAFVYKSQNIFYVMNLPQFELD